jgi:hypothetical protein
MAGRQLNTPSTWGDTIEERFARAVEAPAVVADPDTPAQHFATRSGDNTEEDADFKPGSQV